MKISYSSINYMQFFLYLLNCNINLLVGKIFSIFLIFFCFSSSLFFSLHLTFTYFFIPCLTFTLQSNVQVYDIKLVYNICESRFLRKVYRYLNTLLSRSLVPCYFHLPPNALSPRLSSHSNKRTWNCYYKYIKKNNICAAFLPAPNRYNPTGNRLQKNVYKQVTKRISFLIE